MGGIVGGALSLGGAVMGGNSAPSSPSVNVYQPRDTANVDNLLSGLFQDNTAALTGGNNPYAQLSPQIQQAFAQLFNTPGTAGYNAAAGNAGNAYNTVGNNSINLSQLLSTAAPAALNAGTSVLNMGLDPQNDLYKQQLQKTTDLANVTNAQYGLTGQQAAGAVNQADTNFNIDWQNNELQRALSSLQGFDQTLTNVGQTSTAAQNVGAAGAGSVLSGGAAPYTVGQTIGGNQETALTQYLSQLMGPVNSTQADIGNLLQYLGLGVDASTAGANQNLQDYYAQLAGASAGAAGGASLGNSVSGLFNTQASGSGGLSSLASLASLATLFA